MRLVGSQGNRAPTTGSFSEKILKEPITREVLIGIKTRGLRRRLWYSSLSLMERGLVDLTIRWVDRVRSGRLAETLLRILEKLALAMEAGMGRVLGRGRMLAARASELAVGWGNSSAFYWRFETAFANALGHGITG